MRHALLVALTLLAGCGTIRLPELPKSLSSECSDPGVRAGKSALTELGRNRVALADCRKKHAGTVRFYNGLRK